MASPKFIVKGHFPQRQMDRGAQADTLVQKSQNQEGGGGQAIQLHRQTWHHACQHPSFA